MRYKGLLPGEGQPFGLGVNPLAAMRCGGTPAWHHSHLYGLPYATQCRFSEPYYGLLAPIIHDA
ncbi:hypothetical protein GCM10022265_02840 [Marinobacter xestospongiae]